MAASARRWWPSWPYSRCRSVAHQFSTSLYFRRSSPGSLPRFLEPLWPRSPCGYRSLSPQPPWQERCCCHSRLPHVAGEIKQVPLLLQKMMEPLLLQLPHRSKPARAKSSSTDRRRLVRGPLPKQTVTPLPQQQIKEWPDEVDGKPDHSNPQDLLDHRQIILQDHKCHPDVTNDRYEQTGEYRDPGGTSN